MFQRIRQDIGVVFDRDPAARSIPEILLCYPGIHALLVFRFAHWLWTRDFKLLARFCSHIARVFTGIEIHPGARIGAGFFIDHGMGVVIGETTEIGDNVTLYHGVTLGGTSWNKGKRHPTLEDNVIIGAGAKVLGPITVGANARVGSNAVVVADVPPDTTVVGVPGRLVVANQNRDKGDLAHFPAYGQGAAMPDPVAKAIACVLEQMHHLDDRLEALEEDNADATVAGKESSVVLSLDRGREGRSLEGRCGDGRDGRNEEQESSRENGARKEEQSPAACSGRGP